MEKRWLLPFTCGIDHRAIEAAVHMAVESGAMLIPVVIRAGATAQEEIRACAGNGRQTSELASPVPSRLKPMIPEQSALDDPTQEFLATVKAVATHYHVPIEQHEVFTGSVNHCIKMLIWELCCDSIILVVSTRQGVLLQTDDVACLLSQPYASLVLIRLPEESPAHLGQRLFSWLRKRLLMRSKVKRPLVCDTRTHPAYLPDYVGSTQE